jgi:endonuclease YncB( thermonuclease family)
MVQSSGHAYRIIARFNSLALVLLVTALCGHAAARPSGGAAQASATNTPEPTPGYELSPLIVTGVVPQPTPARDSSFQRYSDLEYSRLILSTLALPEIQPLSGPRARRSIVRTETTSDGLTRYAQAEAEVIDVLNRCVLLLDTGEQVRLRGVRCYSLRDPDPVVRLYVREATRKLREMTRGQKVRLILDDPLRDLDGNILAVVVTPGGVELNRFMLEQGYGYVEPSDFYPFQDLTPLYKSESLAREAFRGIWSHNNK